MGRSKIFEELNRISDPVKDYTKILSNLHYTHFYLMDRYKKILSSFDLSPAQSNVLGIIHFLRPAHPSLEQVKEMILEPGSDVSRILTRLCEKGYAEKIRDPQNKRKIVIKITDAGEKVFNKITSDRRMRSFTAKLSLHEAQVLTTVLAKLRDSKNI